MPTGTTWEGAVGAAVRAWLFATCLVLAGSFWLGAAAATATPSRHSVTAAEGAPPQLCAGSDTDHGTATTKAADDAAVAEDWATAKSIYTEVLASTASSTGERECAARGLAYVAVKSQVNPTQGAAVKSAWDHFYAKWVKPAWRFGTPALAVLAVLMIVLRLVTSTVCRWPKARGLRTYNWWRCLLLGGAWLIGLAAVAWAAVMLTVGLSLADGGKHAWAIRWMQPAAGLVATAALAVLVIVVGLVGRRHGWRWVIVIGSAAVICAFGIWLALRLRHDESWAEIVRVAVGSALVGIVLAARVRGVGMGLRIEGFDKSGADDKGLAADIRARLVALGSRKPSGITMTQQSDVSTLPQDALSLVPDGPTAKAAALILKLFTRSEPWRITVTERPDGAIGVEVLHNRTVVRTEVVDAGKASLDTLPAKPLRDSKDELTAEAKGRALRTAAASFILLQLSEFHDHLTDGLVGTRNWRSLAAHVIALEPSTGLSEVAQRRLLTNSVGIDEGNLAAWSALLLLEYAKGDVKDEEAYLVAMVGLLEKIEKQSDGKSLLMRARFNMAVSGCNLGLLQREHHLAKAIAAFDDAHEQVCALAKTLLGGKNETEFESEMRQSTHWLHLVIDGERHKLRPYPERLTGCPDPDHEPEGVPDPFARYERACYLVEKDAERALADLAIAVSQPGLRASAATDPSFTPLYRDLHDPKRLDMAKRFKKCVGEPVAKQFLDLAPFADKKSELSARGITTATALLRVSAPTLAAELALSALTVAAWRRTARLSRFVSRHPGASPYAEAESTTALLGEAGVTSVTELRAKVRGKPGAFEGELRDAAAKLDVLPPSTDTLAGWRAHTTASGLAREYFGLAVLVIVGTRQLARIVTWKTGSD